MATTKAPSGLAIARNNNLSFTCSWKIADTDYAAGHQFRYRYQYGYAGKAAAWSAWTTVTVGAKVTSRVISYTTTSFFPTVKKVMYAVQFQVRGKRKNTTAKGVTTSYAWSAWTTATKQLYAPNIPSLSASLNSELDNRTTFTWNTTVSDTSNQPFYNCEYQTILVKASTINDGSKLPWKSSTLGWGTANVSRNSSATFTEDATALSNSSYTRWFRVRSRGAGGYNNSQGPKSYGTSYWRYAKHVYAMPVVPTISSAVKEGTNPIWVRAKWVANQNAAYPIDKVQVEYGIGTPDTGLAAPAGLSWTTVATYADTGGDDGSYFQITNPELDQLVWVRVTAIHDRKSRSSAPFKVTNGTRPFSPGLKPPTNLTVTNINTSLHRADVHVEHASSVPDSKIAIIYKETGQGNLCVAVLNHNQTDVTVQCPDWGSNTFSFVAYEFQGSTTTKTARGVTTYTITYNMISATVSSGGDVPMPPTNIQVAASDTDGEAIVTWDWAWTTGTTGMEISWSKNRNSWESTDQPTTFNVSDINAAKWRITGLDASVWYFRLRQFKETGNSTSYGPYSDIYELNTTITENVEYLPVLTLSTNVLPAGEEFTASWVYPLTDNSSQTYSEICEATVEEVEGETVITYGEVLAHTTTEQHVNITVPETWDTGETYFLCVRIRRENEVMTDWSAPVSISIADPVTCTITDSPFVEETEGEDEDERTYMALKEMPFSITIEGAGEGDVTSLIIERDADYHIDRPDENVFNGYEGESILSYSQNGDAEITINYEDLNGCLDDGAEYRLIAIVNDALGQVAVEEIPFEVHWTHQALIPEGTVEILSDYNVAKITPIAPTGAIQTDVCDIYRLSVDKPELVYQNATFGTSYVDLYPAIGEFGGYRLVFKTANNDYITEDNEIAWLDLDSEFSTLDHIIDFGGDSVKLRYNVDLSNSWSKDFTETRYLGGSIQGDWNPSVSRTGDISGVAVLATDQDTIESLRRLAVYAGVCHVRTRDGSSFDANVDVSENRGHEPGDLVAEFTLSITRVDSVTVAGMTYADWLETIQEE